MGAHRKIRRNAQPGTPGHLIVAETATLKATGKAAADAFTAEEIHITAK
jgi:hypothetical protein